MTFADHLTELQKDLHQAGCDGWLLYDFRKSNDLACRFLEITERRMVTRRLFYWIPCKGNPIKLLHRIETHLLDHLPGSIETYSSWLELEECLGKILSGKKKIAMEYSPRNAIPYVSKVDGGTIELVKSYGVEIISSADYLQRYTCVWDEQQMQMHLMAVDMLEEIVSGAWELISSGIRNERQITEQNVQNFILDEFAKRDCLHEGLPICAVNAHSANPHYEITSESNLSIRSGDFILIDLWGKINRPRAVYADITRVAVAASQPTLRQQEIFEIVKDARDEAVRFLVQKLQQGTPVRGWEVDEACRKVIISKGYGQYFTHRTGHNIGERDHGDGANIDNFETKDLRLLLPQTCFSIEPGIYLPEEFGIRLEDNVVIESGGRSCKITSRLQTSIECLPL